MTTATIRSTSSAALVAALLVSGLSACGESDAEKKAEQDFGEAADQTTCLADAKAAAKPWPDGFPGNWPFPARTKVFNVEDRGDSGVIATGISGSSFHDILDFMNGDAVDAGFKIESGETEEHDAEAEWEGNGFRGRWAIRESGNCPGETVIQVVSIRD